MPDEQKAWCMIYQGGLMTQESWNKHHVQCLSKSIPFKMGLQIPRSVHPEKKEKDIVSETCRKARPGIPRSGTAERMRNPGR